MPKLSSFFKELKRHYFGVIINGADGEIRIRNLRISSELLYKKSKRLTSIHTYKSLDFGGDKEARTPDLLSARQALSQLSYTPTYGYSICWFFAVIIRRPIFIFYRVPILTISKKF